MTQPSNTPTPWQLPSWNSVVPEWAVVRRLIHEASDILHADNHHIEAVELENQMRRELEREVNAILDNKTLALDALCKELEQVKRERDALKSEPTRPFAVIELEARCRLLQHERDEARAFQNDRDEIIRTIIANSGLTEKEGSAIGMVHSITDLAQTRCTEVDSLRSQLDTMNGILDEFRRITKSWIFKCDELQAKVKELKGERKTARLSSGEEFEAWLKHSKIEEHAPIPQWVLEKMKTAWIAATDGAFFEIQEWQHKFIGVDRTLAIMRGQLLASEHSRSKLVEALKEQDLIVAAKDILTLSPREIGEGRYIRLEIAIKEFEALTLHGQPTQP